jgi:transcriptional regulator with XRE-family HTH domain
MPKTSRLIAGLPGEVTDALKIVGDNIRIARTRRRETQVRFAERLLASVPTLRRIEHGDANVSAGAVFVAIWCLGMTGQLRALVNPDEDEVGRLHAARTKPLRGRARPVDLLPTLSKAKK